MLAIANAASSQRRLALEVPFERGESAKVAATQTRVEPTTHGFRRRVASETAPIQGARTSTTAEERLVASEYAVLEAPRSVTIQTTKYSVATFIEKMVLAKS